MKVRKVLVAYRGNKEPYVSWWNEEYAPARLGVETLIQLDNPPIKVIAEDDYKRSFIVCRTDHYPLMWAWWLLLYKLGQTLKFTETWIVLVAGVWGIGYTEPCCYARLTDLFKRKPTSKNNEPRTKDS